MEREKLKNILDYYYATSTLKEVERTGWKYWNISRDKRIESIPEHVYGTEHLAMAIFSEFDLDIDIYKVVTMLSIHETEEIDPDLGDKTPFDTITEQEKLEKGKLAVEKVVSTLQKKNLWKELIDEFNEKKTPEAKFAYLCDKMECDLQAKKYSDEGRCSFENVCSNVIEDERVKKIIADGAKNIGEVFIAYDANKYAESTIFSEMIQILKDYSIK